jgi:hypothetical protein
MAFVLVIVAMVAILATGMFQLTRSITNRLSEATDKKRAFYMAESGLAEGYAGLLIGKTGNVGTSEQPAAYGDGLFWVTAEESEDDTVELVSTGMVGRGRAVLSLVVERGESSVAELGMFWSSAPSVGTGSLVDGFDSSQGSYESQVLGGLAPIGAGRLGSNEAITADGSAAAPTTINAEVAPGPEEELVTNELVTLHGSVTAARATTPLPQVDVPQVSVSRGIEHTSSMPLLLQPGTTGLEFLHVGGTGSVLVEGPATLVLGALSVEPGAELVIDSAGGPVDIYVTGGLDLQSDASVVTPSADPASVTIQVAGSPREPVRLAATGAFHGVIYAPEAEVQVEAPFEVFGALVGDRAVLGAGVRLHFDRELAKQSVLSSLPKLLTWRIVELSSAGLASRDPFFNLGVDPAGLRSPAGAHADQLLHVEYLDSVGTPLTYDGMESAFDWSIVTGVDLLIRDGVVVTALDAADVVLPPGDRALIDLIESDMAARDVTRALLDNSPLSSTVLEAAMNKSAPLLSDHYRRILLASSPLPPRVLDMVVRDAPSLMTAAHRDEVLLAQ